MPKPKRKEKTMNYEEARKIAEQHNWGGAVGREMWREFEATYLTSDLTKTQFVYLYWMRTGYYEQLAYAVKKYDLAVDALKECLNVTDGAGIDRTAVLADGLADRAYELKKVMATVKAVCDDANIK